MEAFQAAVKYKDSAASVSDTFKKKTIIGRV